jgi:hypothetical protein
MSSSLIYKQVVFLSPALMWLAARSIPRSTILAEPYVPTKPSLYLISILDENTYNFNETSF